MNAQAAGYEIYDSAADAQARLNAETQRGLDLAQVELSAQSQTTEQRAEQIDMLIAEQSALQDYVDSHNLTADATTQLTTQIEGLGSQITELSAINHTWADDLQLEADLKQALIDQSDHNTKALQDWQDAQQKLEAATQKAAQAQESLTQVTLDHTAKVGEITADADEKELETAQKQREKLAQMDAQFALKEQQQRERNNLTIQEQVAAGDIAAAQQAIYRDNLTVKQDQETFDQQKAVQTKSDQEQLAALERQEEKLLASEDARYAKEYQQKELANATALQQEQFLDDKLAALQAASAFTQQYWAGEVSSSYDAVAASGGALADQTSNLGYGIAGLSTLFAQATQQVQTFSGAFGGWSGGGGIGAIGRMVGGGIGTFGDLINATQSGYDYANNVYPISFTGTPFPTHDYPGVAMAGQTYSIGRQELFTPYTGGQIVPLGGASMGGSSPTNITIDARGSNIPQAQWKQWGERVKVDIVRSLNEQREAAARRTP